MTGLRPPLPDTPPTDLLSRSHAPPAPLTYFVLQAVVHLDAIQIPRIGKEIKALFYEFQNLVDFRSRVIFLASHLRLQGDVPNLEEHEEQLLRGAA